MTGTIEIKLTVSEVVTPSLFAALMEVSNPRQRAALLKRLADDALRGRENAGLAYSAQQGRTVETEVSDSGTLPAQTQVKPASVVDRRPQTLADSKEAPSETSDDAHLNYLADSLSAFA
ncbi:hypothetical protein NK8_86010 (plasmid) [Caballeronia sp. NK8]|uniref:hypothetical protein n=1 Tax=Caballeronia sp. NK8 TaxID=140098 RepID=UPI001BB5A270|nr:hypothetical protein [Caballeronia sp. NK8]BCQ30410.1 hypothetical protein NK8_86010 [Caballeronia sp. NK8]